MEKTVLFQRVRMHDQTARGAQAKAARGAVQPRGPHVFVCRTDETLAREPKEELSILESGQNRRQIVIV